MNKARNQAMRNVWNKKTGQNSEPGTSSLNLIKKFNGTYKKHVGGKKNKSRKSR